MDGYEYRFQELLLMQECDELTQKLIIFFFTFGFS